MEKMTTMNLRKYKRNKIFCFMRSKTKEIIIWFLNKICDFYPMRDEIILESYPDFSCNTYELYKYMLRKNVNRKYTITWLVDNKIIEKPKENNVEYLERDNKKWLNWLKIYYRCNRAKLIISCNRIIPKSRSSKKQLNIYLDHGSHLKNMAINGIKCPIDCDYLIIQSEFFRKVNLEQYDIKNHQIISLGLPRNDLLFKRDIVIDKLIPNYKDYRFIIIWTPTFREHRNKIRIDCQYFHPFGLPILSKNEDIFLLNDILVDNNILMIIKPHPAQNLDILKSFELSNIKFLYNSELECRSIQINELLTNTDALITDYSSIYYDYLLTNKPIGITLDDFSSYKEEHGFVFEKPLDIIKGYYINNLQDMIQFIQDTAFNKDVCAHDRNTIKNMLHYYQDNNNTKRVFDFIFSKLEEKS